MTKQEDFTTWYAKTKGLIERQIEEIKNLQISINQLGASNEFLEGRNKQLDKDNRILQQKYAELETKYMKLKSEAEAAKAKPINHH